MFKPGMNEKAHVRGGLFVKPVTTGGSPYAEEAASRAFGLLGVPRLPVRAVRLASGDLAAVSKFQPKMTTLNQLDAPTARAHAHEILDPKRHGALALANYVVNAVDRHGGNFAHVPGKGVLSIDHGESWNSLNNSWPSFHSGERKHAMYGMVSGEEGWSRSPRTSALHSLLHPSYVRDHITAAGNPSHPDTHPIDPALIDRVVQHADALEQLAYEGTRGLPEEERVLAKLGVRLRIQNLAANRPTDVGGLHDMHLEHGLEAARQFLNRGAR